MHMSVIVTPVENKADLKSFIDLPWIIYADDPNWVAPLRGEARDLVTPGRNPFFSHAEAQYFLARRGTTITGRISAHVDHLALTVPREQGMGPGTGNFGLFDAMDGSTAAALLDAAEKWLRSKDMSRVLGPLSLSIWEEPGLLIDGYDHPPTVMMGHDSAAYRPWIERMGYEPVKQLKTWDLDITKSFPPLIQRIIRSGEKNPRIRVRTVDKSRFQKEASIIMGILNDAWGRNWGFVPVTDEEIAFTGKKLKPIVFEDLIMIAELDGEPVAFMMTLPDLNEVLLPLKGSLAPFGWAKLLLWLRRPKVRTMRVPLMGVVQKLQSSRLASQLAFMMIERIRQASVANYGAVRGEIGWILDDNQGMNAIAEALGSKVNKVYQIYEKRL